MDTEGSLQSWPRKWSWTGKDRDQMKLIGLLTNWIWDDRKKEVPCLKTSYTTMLLNEINSGRKWDINGFRHIALRRPLAFLHRNSNRETRNQ